MITRQRAEMLQKHLPILVLLLLTGLQPTPAGASIYRFVQKAVPPTNKSLVSSTGVFLPASLTASSLHSRRSAIDFVAPSSGTCTVSTPCPVDGQFYFCLEGSNVNGCQPLLSGPWMSSDCSSQCTTSIPSAPSTTPPPTATPAPSTTPSPSPAPSSGTCTVSTPCPVESQFYFCLAGSNVNGCQPLLSGPWMSSDCSSQCTTAVPSIPSPSPSPSPSSGKNL